MPKRQPAPRPATVEYLAPEIREAIAIVVSEIYDREEDDFYQHGPGERGEHPFLALERLRVYLGPYVRPREGDAP
ncbi:hypothetical protein [Nocardia sp. NBC_01327]|uniref:hypothetical protein n=1 Tax=Nocardia sp. NBC_01327 TaxID=2903593 RepID=UPI002E131E97|nr:hypothetical protein OG326_42380 [Nocardia sp. NBC_01327]